MAFLDSILYFIKIMIVVLYKLLIGSSGDIFLELRNDRETNSNSYYNFSLLIRVISTNSTPFFSTPDSFSKRKNLMNTFCYRKYNLMKLNRKWNLQMWFAITEIMKWNLWCNLKTIRSNGYILIREQVLQLNCLDLNPCDIYNLCDGEHNLTSLCHSLLICKINKDAYLIGLFG